MSSAEVHQLGTLSDLFAEVLGRCRPLSVAVLGIAGGNGLDHIDSSITARVVGLDLNPLYLEAVRNRYAHLSGLELHCVDLSEQHVELEPVHLVHAALVLEHAGVDCCLDNALSMIASGGNLSVVLQLPAESDQAVIVSRFSSIQNLESHFSLISPTWLCESLVGRGFRLIHQTKRPLPAGKGFWMGIFSAPGRREVLLSEKRDIPADKVIALYVANGWSAAKKPQELWNALRNSHSLVSAWVGEELVGLGNALSDGYLVVYYPHLLVLPSFQGRGIGGKILEHLKRKYQGFHQHILVADGRAIEFYKKHGFETAGKTQSMWIYQGVDH